MCYGMGCPHHKADDEDMVATTLGSGAEASGGKEEDQDMKMLADTKGCEGCGYAACTGIGHLICFNKQPTTTTCRAMRNGRKISAVPYNKEPEQ